MCNQTHPNTNMHHNPDNITHEKFDKLKLQFPLTHTQGTHYINESNENDVKDVDGTTHSDVCDNPTIIENNNSPEKLNTSYQNETPDDKNPDIILNELRKKNVGRLIVGHLNINSIRNKFEVLKSLVQDNIESFPTSQFAINGYTNPIRLDRNDEGGGIIIYIRADIPCKVLKNHLPKNVEGLYIELNLRSKKWLLFGGYNPKKETISYFLDHLSKDLDKFIGRYDNLLLIGDFKFPNGRRENE